MSEAASSSTPKGSGGGLAGGGAGLVSVASLGRVARNPMNLIFV